MLPAHPHVKITAGISFNYEGRICRSMRVEWMFDDYFSASIIQEYDMDRDGIFNEKEKKILYNEAFSNLKNYGYFIYIRDGSARTNPGRVTDFDAWHKDGVLFYAFTVPLDKKDYGDDFYVAIFDRSFYCAVFYNVTPVVINQKTGVKPFYEITKNKKFPVYYNPTGSPDDMTIYKKWRRGLETSYPDEIHVFFGG